MLTIGYLNHHTLQIESYYLPYLTLPLYSTLLYFTLILCVLWRTYYTMIALLLLFFSFLVVMLQPPQFIISSITYITYHHHHYHPSFKPFLPLPPLLRSGRISTFLSFYIRIGHLLFGLLCSLVPTIPQYKYICRCSPGHTTIRSSSSSLQENNNGGSKTHNTEDCTSSSTAIRTR